MSRAFLVLSVCVMLGSARASAEPAPAHPRVLLELDACVAGADAVRRVVGIELGALLDDGGGVAGARTRAHVACREALLALRVDDPITGKGLEREIDLRAASPDARARLLGLAIAELISASWIELVANPEPKVPPAGPRASPESRESARAAVGAKDRPALFGLRLSAIGVGRGMFEGTGFLGGGGLRIGRHHPYHLGWLIDVEVVHGSASTTLGEVSTDLLSVGAVLVAHQVWKKVALHGGIGLRGGAARIAGDPRAGSGATGRALWGAWGGPLGTLGVVVAPQRRWFLELGLEAGYVVLPVAGLVGTQRAVAVDGAWIGFSGGVGIIL